MGRPRRFAAHTKKPRSGGNDVRDAGSPTPAGPPWMYLAIAGGALVVSFIATFSTTVRATRIRPVAALTA